MHDNSMRLMREFIQGEMDALCDYRDGLRIVDVGSMDVNGTYRDLIPDRHHYTGIDVEAGDNVDKVVSPYTWGMHSTADVIISGQCLEHVKHPWLWFDELKQTLKPRGLACVIAPSAGPQHRYPVDCYRYMPDGMGALAQWAGLKVLAVDYDKDSKWGDVRLIARRAW